MASATVHELVLGLIDPQQAERRISGPEKLLGDYAYSVFCIDGTNECCPDSNCKTAGKPAWQ